MVTALRSSGFHHVRSSSWRRAFLFVSNPNLLGPRIRPEVLSGLAYRVALHPTLELITVYAVAWLYLRLDYLD